MELIFGQDPVFKTHCKQCGLPIFDGDKGCPKCKYVKVKKERQPERHGKSKSPARFYNQEQQETNKIWDRA